LLTIRIIKYYVEFVNILEYYFYHNLLNFFKIDKNSYSITLFFVFLQLRFDKIDFMKVIVRRTSKRILSIRVGDEIIFVDAYRKMRISEIKQILESKKDWIFAHAHKTSNVDEVTTSCKTDVQADFEKDIAEMFCAKKVLLNGVVYGVVCSKQNKTCFDGQNVLIPENSYFTKEARLKALRLYVKKFTTQNVSEKISDFGCYAALCPSQISFKKLADGWVKCSSPTERIITLDYRIAQLPDDLQRYLIAHAFAHFGNAEHDGKFWNTLSNYCPEYMQCVEKLEKFEFLKEIFS